MFAKVIELFIGLDDLERVANRDNIQELNEYLKSRTIWIARKPQRFLDAANFDEQQLMQMITDESEKLNEADFQPWVLELNGKRRLPIFSSMRKMDVFSKRISTEMNKVFALGGVESLLSCAIKSLEVDVVV